MTVATRPRTWRWVVFFAVLASLAGLGIVLPIVYNLGQQLRPEQLEAARRLWDEHGPADYDLTFAVTYDRERLAERHIVRVRGGQVVFASCEGELVQLGPALAAAVGLPIGGLGRGTGLGVPGIFDHIEALLRQQSTEGRRNFLVAVFDPHEGYPRRFIYRLRGTRTREEWDVRLWKPGELERLTSRRDGP
jgi:hypothetical protein